MKKLISFIIVGCIMISFIMISVITKINIDNNGLGNKIPVFSKYMDFSKYLFEKGILDISFAREYSLARGVIDTSFGNSGIVVHHNAAGGNFHDYGNSICVDSEGKIYITGFRLEW